MSEETETPNDEPAPPPGPNHVPKRLRIALRADSALARIASGLVDLRECAWDLAQSGGAYQQGDFAGSDLQHLDADDINALLSVGILRLAGASAAPLSPDDPESPTLDDLVRRVKRG